MVMAGQNQPHLRLPFQRGAGHGCSEPAASRALLAKGEYGGSSGVCNAFVNRASVTGVATGSLRLGGSWGPPCPGP